jgi:hypothetical protein
MITFGTAAANALLASIRDLADAGSGPAVIHIYSGPFPMIDGQLFTANVLLAELTCSDPCGTAIDQTLVFGPITGDMSVNALGVATFFRLMDSDLNVIAQGTVTIGSGSGELHLNVTYLVQGSDLEITSATITLI